MFIDLDQMILTLTFSVQGHLIILVNLCVKVFFHLYKWLQKLYLWMFIDFDQISWTATFQCDPDLDFLFKVF